MPIQTALMGVVPPVVIALVVLVAAWRPWSKTPPAGRAGVIGSALAIALAYVVTERLVIGTFPGFPPSERHRWLPCAALAAALGAMAWPRKIAARWWWHDLIALALFVMLYRRSLMSTDMAGLYIPILAKVLPVPMALVAALWIVLTAAMNSSVRSDAARLSPCGARAPLTWWVASVGAAVVYVQSDEVIFGQLAGVLAAVMGVLVVLGLWRRQYEFVTGAAPVFGVVYMGLMLCSHTTVVSSILIMLAAACPALAGGEAAARRKPWVTMVLCMGAAALLSALAVWQSPNGFNFNMNGSP